MKIIVVGGADLDQMVGAISRSANSQNTVQPADFSANDSFHVAIEELANNTWLPDSRSRWFYERARGSYSATEAKLSHSSVQKRRFHQETPKSRRFSKTDLAKYLNAWNGFPHLVSFGNQKNFQHFMQNMKERYPDGWLPDADWYRRFIATAIVFRTMQSIVKAAKFPAYQANITAYTVAALSFKYRERMNLDLIWRQQCLSPELADAMKAWAGRVDDALRKTSGAKMPSEWAKKYDCWQAIAELSTAFPDVTAPEVIEPAAAEVKSEGVAGIGNRLARL